MTTYGELRRLLGLDEPTSSLTFQHMALRGVVVFIFGVVLVRFADRRFLGRNAGFDVLLGFILGSVLSRGINGQAPFFPTLGASGVLVFLHHLLSSAASRWHFISQLVKGRSYILIRDGKIDHQQLKRCKISEDDLDENLRVNGNVETRAQVKLAVLERNGAVSVVKSGK